MSRKPKHNPAGVICRRSPALNKPIGLSRKAELCGLQGILFSGVSLFGTALSLTLKVIFVLWLYAATAAGAQESPVAPDANATEPRQGRDEPGAQDAEANAPQTFDPTEEVSEDYSIEFPVDI